MDLREDDCGANRTAHYRSLRNLLVRSAARAREAGLDREIAQTQGIKHDLW